MKNKLSDNQVHSLLRRYAAPVQVTEQAIEAMVRQARVRAVTLREDLAGQGFPATVARLLGFSRLAPAAWSGAAGMALALVIGITADCRGRCRGRRRVTRSTSIMCWAPPRSPPARTLPYDGNARAAETTGFSRPGAGPVCCPAGQRAAGRHPDRPRGKTPAKPARDYFFRANSQIAAGGRPPPDAPRLHRASPGYPGGGGGGEAVGRRGCSRRWPPLRSMPGGCRRRWQSITTISSPCAP